MKNLFVLFILFATIISAAEWTGSASLGYQHVKDYIAVDDSTNYIDLDLSFIENVSADLELGASIGSSNGDPRVTTQVLSGNMETKDFRLKKAYLSYNYSLDESTLLSFTGGKFGKNFVSASDMIWDKDLAFEGFGFDLVHTLLEGNKVYFHSGVYNLDEFTAADNDPKLVVSQLGISGKYQDINYDVYGGLINYYNIKNKLPLKWTVNSNSLNLLGNYTYDYDAIEFGSTFTKTIGENEIKLLGNWIENTDSDDKAYLLGIEYGNLTVVDKEDWKLYSNIRKIEQDSVLDCYTDSDFHSGMTNSKGYKVGLEYGIEKNLKLDVNYTKTKDHESLAPVEQSLFKTELVINF
ncbi:putative porin [Candidatus Pacearchaeota archaeon]|nr:putative porin [Candidatus Pacearchaeota archaeon]